MEKQHPEFTKDDVERKEVYLDLIAQAFMREALVKLIAEKRKDRLVDTDRLYMYFANNEFLPFEDVCLKIGQELNKFLKNLEQEAELAFEKLPIKFSGHRLD